MEENKAVINEDTQKYLDRFYEPKVTSFEFVCLLISVLKVCGVQSFKHKEIEEHILNCKKMNLFTDLFEEITYKPTGIKEYSVEFEDAITTARNSGLIYSVSPEVDSTVIIRNFDEMEYISNKKEYISPILSFLLIIDLINEIQFEETKEKLIRHI